MKNNNSPITFYAAFLITATLTLGISVGLNFLWFGLYEFVKQYFEMSFPRAAIAMGSLVWFLAMARAIPILSAYEKK
jgi:hypothetical protein